MESKRYCYTISNKSIFILDKEHPYFDTRGNKKYFACDEDVIEVIVLGNLKKNEIENFKKEAREKCIILNKQDASDKKIDIYNKMKKDKLKNEVIRLHRSEIILLDMIDRLKEEKEYIANECRKEDNKHTHEFIKVSNLEKEKKSLLKDIEIYKLQNENNELKIVEETKRYNALYRNHMDLMEVNKKLNNKLKRRETHKREFELIERDLRAKIEELNFRIENLEMSDSNIREMNESLNLDNEMYKICFKYQKEEISKLNKTINNKE